MSHRTNIVGARSTFDRTQYALPYAPGVEDHFWHRARNRIVERHLRRSQAVQARPAAVVLDVGCGPGIVVQHLREKGFDCYGVELGHPDVRPAAKPFVQTGTEAIAVGRELRERTATILLLDVVEHIQEPTL